MHDFDLEKTLSSDSINISSDMLEIGLDSILKDGLLKDIPVFSTLTSIAKLGLNIKDRLFIKKLVHFLYETQNISISKRQEVIDEINKSQKYQSTVGEKLIFIIDKSDEISKARHVGKLFSFVLSQKISYTMFVRCSEAINKTFNPDLEWFLSQSHYGFHDSLERDSLMNSGILKITYAKGESTFGESTFELKYEISDIGLCLHKYLGKSVDRLLLIDDKKNNKW